MDSTIAAISTIVGESAINIIKVSGKDSISIVNKIFRGKDLIKVDSHTIHYGFIMDDNDKVDEVLVSIFKAPKTYTKEDMVEINCHGGIAVTNKILELVLNNGAIMAQPGEFIKRAYLNGRVNLIEAEAVSDLITAKTEVARKIGIKGITGESSKMIKNLREELLSIIANIEVNIDYPEYEDALVVTNRLLKEKLSLIKKSIENIIEKSKNQILLKNGISVAIVGKPNVGKSSLLNRLIDEDKAIVTNIEGTTRDIVEGSIILNGIEIKFIDTAGIRKTDNEVEQLGVNKSYKVIDNSDLVLLVISAEEQISDEELKLLKSINNKEILIVINKSDKSKIVDMTALNNYNKVYTTCVEENGINSLKEEIVKMFKLNKINTNDYTYLSNSRQLSILKECSNIVKDIEKEIKEEVSIDLIEIDIKALWDKLGEILGESYKEDLLDKIFSKFCLGK